MESEKTLSAWWGSATGRTVSTTSGVAYRIQYPGRLNGAGGPDYRGAVLHDGDRAMLGDVELHVRSSDWRRHGHDRDHGYDGVVLHVVFKDDCGGRTQLASGARVPVAVARAGPFPASISCLPCESCYAAEAAKVSEVLAREGMARLLRKGRRAAEAMARVGQREALLCLVARTLGYSSNTPPFENAARRLSSLEVRAVLPSCSSCERRALALGIGGLLPSQRGMRQGRDLDDCSQYESAWRSMGLEHMAMPAREWNMGCIYPNNHPVRRMVGLADLLPGLPHVVDELSDSAAGRLQNNPPLTAFEERVTVQGDDYWRRHFDFGLATPESGVVGRGKAREIVVNALIPLAVAMASGDVLLLARLGTAIREYPSTGQNAVTKHMRAQLGIGRAALPAVQSQGMLRLFQMYCTRGLCTECFLGYRLVAL